MNGFIQWTIAEHWPLISLFFSKCYFTILSFFYEGPQWNLYIVFTWMNHQMHFVMINESTLKSYLIHKIFLFCIVCCSHCYCKELTRELSSLHQVLWKIKSSSFASNIFNRIQWWWWCGFNVLINISLS